ncbi:MAG: hypothetical protein ACKPKO_16975, partial [Candidatus Fonsibacter sp.]
YLPFLFCFSLEAGSCFISPGARLANKSDQSHAKGEPSTRLEQHPGLLEGTHPEPLAVRGAFFHQLLQGNQLGFHVLGLHVLHLHATQLAQGLNLFGFEHLELLCHFLAEPCQVGLVG